MCSFYALVFVVMFRTHVQLRILTVSTVVKVSKVSNIDNKNEETE